MASGSHHSSGSHSGSHHSSSHSSSSSHHSSSHSSYSHSHSSHSSSNYQTVHPAFGYRIPKKGVFFNEQDILPGGVTYDEYRAKLEQSNIHETGNTVGSGMSSTANPNIQPHISEEDLIIYAPKKKKRAEDEYSPIKEEKISHGASWVSGNSYCLNTKDPYFTQNYPNPTFAKPNNIILLFGIIAFILFGLAGSNLEYELLIRPFESMSMTDGAFTFFDNLIYYGQFAIPVILFLVGLFLSKKKHKQNEMFVRELIKFYSVEEERIHYERTHEFLAVCPQCGAPRQSGDIACQYCGASLVRETHNE